MNRNVDASITEESEVNEDDNEVQFIKELAEDIDDDNYVRPIQEEVECNENDDEDHSTTNDTSSQSILRS